MPSKGALVAALNNDAAFLHLLQALLHEEGYETLLLHAGEIALDTIKQKRPKLIILDIDAANPNVSWKLVDLLALDPEAADIPLIICSIADEGLAARREKIEASGCNVIEKPFSINELLEIVRQLLQSPSS